MIMRPLTALALTLPLAACFGFSDPVTVTVRCPDQLVSVDEAAPSKRPAKPVRGEDLLPDYLIYIERAEAYMTAQELQASAREEQVAECEELAEAG